MDPEIQLCARAKEQEPEDDAESLTWKNKSKRKRINWRKPHNAKETVWTLMRGIMMATTSAGPMQNNHCLLYIASIELGIIGTHAVIQTQTYI